MQGISRREENVNTGNLARLVFEKGPI